MDDAIARSRSSDNGRETLSLATSIEDYFAVPVDRYFTGPGWLVFVRPDFSGLICWGRIDLEMIRQISALLPIRYMPPARPHATLVDLRFVDGFDACVLDERARIYAQNADRAAAFVTQIALVHAPGLVGAITVGIAALAPPPFPEAFFTDPYEALRWLGKDSEAPTFAQAERLRVASPVTHELRELQTVLDPRKRVSLQAAARALGLSVRSLQRRLADAGTSYQQEVAVATVRLAQRLLLEPGAKITTVAFEVACASPQHLNRLFRKTVGETPSAWRERQLSSPKPRVSARKPHGCAG